jgi:endoglucanase
MLTMQDPYDGGVYHKLTTKEFDAFIMPAATSKPRYVVMKSTAAALDFAATMAAASRTVADYGLADLADEMAQAADHAWAWAVDHPAVFYVQPEDIFTGTYADTSLTDEWFWAAAEMHLLKGVGGSRASEARAGDSGAQGARESAYMDKLTAVYQAPLTPKWDRVNTLGLISLLTSDQRSEFPDIERDFLAHVDRLLEQEARSPYLVSLDRFAWGSNSDVANDGMVKLIAWRLTGDPTYAASAQNDVDYILGRNATGYSFVTGFGDKTPMNPHNRIMGADGIDLPMPGFIAGGPNVNVLTDCSDEDVIRSEFPAASFTDTLCSYSTNETAINWNAPLVFLSSGLDDYYGGARE